MGVFDGTGGGGADKASELANDSGVAGARVNHALDTLNNGKADRADVITGDERAQLAGLPAALDDRPPAVDGRYTYDVLPEDLGGVDGGGPADYAGQTDAGVDGGGPADY